MTLEELCDDLLRSMMVHTHTTVYAVPFADVILLEVVVVLGVMVVFRPSRRLLCSGFEELGWTRVLRRLQSLHLRDHRLHILGFLVLDYLAVGKHSRAPDLFIS